MNQTYPSKSLLFRKFLTISIKSNSSAKNLNSTLKSLNAEISILENKKSTLENNLRETIDKNNNILSHLHWYDFLKQDLSDNYNMNLDEEIIFFSSIINDFKTYDYNILDILKEYKQIQSLRKERDRYSK